jgi:hypothetical protein
MSHGAPHTGAPRGKRVRVVLRDGTVFIEKFWSRDHRYVYFGIPPDLKKVGRVTIKSLTIVR